LFSTVTPAMSAVPLCETFRSFSRIFSLAIIWFLSFREDTFSWFLGIVKDYFVRRFSLPIQMVRIN
jgi:hypothetical protein